MEFVTAEFSGFLTALHIQVSITKCHRDICIFSSLISVFYSELKKAENFPWSLYLSVTVFSTESTEGEVVALLFNEKIFICSNINF